MSIELKLPGAVELRIVVESLPNDVHPPDECVTAHYLRPVMLHLNAAASEADCMERGVEGDAAVRHGDVDVIPHGSQPDAQIRSRVREVCPYVGDLVSSRHLRMNHGVRTQ